MRLINKQEIVHNIKAMTANINIDTESMTVSTYRVWISLQRKKNRPKTELSKKVVSKQMRNERR